MAQKGKPHKERQSKATRTSVTFPAELYAEAERIAEQKKVSFAWVVRDALEKYVEQQYPLFSRKQ